MLWLVRPLFVVSFHFIFNKGSMAVTHTTSTVILQDKKILTLHHRHHHHHY
jgi:hypothetical protein